MRISGFGLTDTGLKRPRNEDTFIAQPDLGLYAVLDGMGGHPAGEVASQTAAEALARYVQNHRHVFVDSDESDQARDQAMKLMRNAVREASMVVFRVASSSSRGKAGMGTTLTAVQITGRKALMAHVGNSRLYLLRGDQLHQLSEDHTYAAEMIRRGGLDAQELRMSGFAHTLTRSVGVQPTVEPDLLLFDLLPDDLLLLCTDGLTRHVEHPAEIQARLTGGVERVPRNLITFANERGGRDNVTVVAIRAEAASAEDTARLFRVQLQLDALRHVELFKHLDLKELVQVMNHMHPHPCQAGQVVVNEGEAGDGLYVVVEGRLVVEKAGRPIDSLETGTHFGEMALLNDRPRSATVRALAESRLLKMPRDQFRELVRDYDRLATKLLWSMAQVLSIRLDRATGEAPDDDPTVPIAPPV